MPRVIVNSTPLIILCNIGKLNLLKSLYDEIIIPNAVYEEVTEKQDSACRQIISAGDWIRVEKIKDQADKRMYKAKQRGIISEISPLIQDMKQKGFYISDSLQQLILRQAGEL